MADDYESQQTKGTVVIMSDEQWHRLLLAAAFLLGMQVAAIILVNVILVYLGR